MFLLIRFIPFILSALVGINLILLFFQEKFFFSIIIVNCIAIIIGTNLLLHKSYQENKKNKSLKFLLIQTSLPFIFVLTVHGFITLLNNSILYFSITGLTSILLFLYLESQFLYLYHPSKYHMQSRENIAEYTSIITIFFISTTFYGLRIFLHTNIILLTTLFTIATISIFIHLYQLHKIENQFKKIIITTSGIIIIEAFLVNHLLTTGIYVSATIIMTLFYIINRINLLFFYGRLNKKNLIRQAGFMIIFLILVLITARWN